MMSEVIDPNFIRLLEPAIAFGDHNQSDPASKALARRLATASVNVGDLLLEPNGLDTAQRMMDVMQGALRFSLRALDVSQRKAKDEHQKAAEAFAERAELFEELVQQREAAAHQRQRAHTAMSQARDAAATVVQQNAMACRLCGKVYTSHLALQSHIMKRHAQPSEAATNAATSVPRDLSSWMPSGGSPQPQYPRADQRDSWLKGHTVISASPAPVPPPGQSEPELRREIASVRESVERLANTISDDRVRHAHLMPVRNGSSVWDAQSHESVALSEAIGMARAQAARIDMLEKHVLDRDAQLLRLSATVSAPTSLAASHAQWQSPAGVPGAGGAVDATPSSFDRPHSPQRGQFMRGSAVSAAIASAASGGEVHPVPSDDPSPKPKPRKTSPQSPLPPPQESETASPIRVLDQGAACADSKLPAPGSETPAAGSAAMPTVPSLTPQQAREAVTSADQVGKVPAISTQKVAENAAPSTPKNAKPAAVNLKTPETDHSSVALPSMIEPHTPAHTSAPTTGRRGLGAAAAAADDDQDDEDWSDPGRSAKRPGPVASPPRDDGSTAAASPVTPAQPPRSSSATSSAPSPLGPEPITMSSMLPPDMSRIDPSSTAVGASAVGDTSGHAAQDQHASPERALMLSPDASMGVIDGGVSPPQRSGVSPMSSPASPNGPSLVVVAAKTPSAAGSPAGSPVPATPARAEPNSNNSMAVVSASPTPLGTPVPAAQPPAPAESTAQPRPQQDMIVTSASPTPVQDTTPLMPPASVADGDSTPEVNRSPSTSSGGSNSSSGSSSTSGSAARDRSPSSGSSASADEPAETKPKAKPKASTGKKHLASIVPTD
jgi:hypothetical protein